MERSIEFQQICDIFQEPSSALEKKKPLPQPILSSNCLLFAQLTQQTLLYLTDNNDLLQKLERLVSMKEFSNDPSKQLHEIISLFETRIQMIQKSLLQLKQCLEKESHSSTSSNSSRYKHQEYIVQYLTKYLANHLQMFKKLIKEHHHSMEIRNQRMSKYNSSLEGSSTSGIPSSSVSSAASSASVSAANGLLFDSQNNQKYAMFTSAPPLISIHKQQELRHRRGGGGVVGGGMNNNTTTIMSNTSENVSSMGSDPINPSSSGSSAGSSSFPRQRPPPPSSSSSASAPSQYQPQQYTQAHLVHQPKYQDYRLQNAQKAETSIRQMGELFSQMASMISEQNEVISRIEDDVESGYENTKQGHEHITRVYEITKSNRSMILKIFGLLLFFILLFLYWT